MTDDFWDDRFHWCALAVGFLAAREGWLDDPERVRLEVYQWYEEGAFEAGRSLITGSAKSDKKVE